VPHLAQGAVGSFDMPELAEPDERPHGKALSAALVRGPAVPDEEFLAYLLQTNILLSYIFMLFVDNKAKICARKILWC